MININRSINISYKNPVYEPASQIRKKMKKRETEGILKVSLIIPNFRHMTAYMAGMQQQKDIYNLKNIKQTNKAWTYYDADTGEITTMTNKELFKKHGTDIQQVISNKLGEDVKLTKSEINKITKNIGRFSKNYGDKNYNNAIKLQGGMLIPSANAKKFLDDLAGIKEQTTQIEEIEEEEEEERGIISKSRYSILEEED